uniref:RESC1/2 CYTH-like domain-containing protein n=1 Tax=Neobodo designis TaxID=312471 RepID=A0A7S1WAX2_NEODS
MRHLIRARRAIKKKVTETYLDARYIQLSNETAQSVLSPELGEVTYCCERVKRKWTTQLDSGVNLAIVETRRTPLIVNKEGDDGERLEYELIANIPQQVERVDLHALADDLWGRGIQMASLLEEGMGELQAHTMSSSAAFQAPN